MAEEESQNLASQPSNLEDTIQYIGERNAILFSAEAGEPLPSLDLPDDFFELDKDDVRHLFKDLKENREAMESGQFRTKAVREMEESMAMLQRLNRYTKTVLRVQFPDRLVLQAVFNHSDTVQTVMDFLKQFLHPPDVQFQLYTAPPKCVLKPESTMVEAKLTPRALVYFGAVPTRDQTTFLESSLLTRLTSPKLASEAALHYRGRGKAKDSDTFLKEATETLAEHTSAEEASTSSLSRKSREGRSTKKQNLNVEVTNQQESHKKKNLRSGTNDYDLYDMVKIRKPSSRISYSNNRGAETKLKLIPAKVTHKTVREKKPKPPPKTKIKPVKGEIKEQNESKIILSRSKAHKQPEQKVTLKIKGSNRVNAIPGQKLVSKTNFKTTGKSRRKVRRQTKDETNKKNEDKYVTKAKTKTSVTKSQIKRHILSRKNVNKSSRVMATKLESSKPVKVDRVAKIQTTTVQRKRETRKQEAVKRKSNISAGPAQKKFKSPMPTKTKGSKSQFKVQHETKIQAIPTRPQAKPKSSSGKRGRNTKTRATLKTTDRNKKQ